MTNEHPCARNTAGCKIVAQQNNACPVYRIVSWRPS